MGVSIPTSDPVTDGPKMGESPMGFDRVAALTFTAVPRHDNPSPSH